MHRKPLFFALPFRFVFNALNYKLSVNIMWIFSLHISCLEQILTLGQERCSLCSSDVFGMIEWSAVEASLVNDGAINHSVDCRRYRDLRWATCSWLMATFISSEGSREMFKASDKPHSDFWGQNSFKTSLLFEMFCVGFLIKLGAFLEFEAVQTVRFIDEG